MGSDDRAHGQRVFNVCRPFVATAQLKILNQLNVDMKFALLQGIFHFKT